MIREILGMVAATGVLIAVLCGTALPHPYVMIALAIVTAWGLS